MLWQLIFKLVSGNFLITAIIMVVIVGIFTYFFYSYGCGGDFGSVAPATVAGMLFPVSLAVSINSSRFNASGNTVLMLVLFLEVILLILNIVNGVLYTREKGISKVISFVAVATLFYYTFGTVIGSSVLYFTRDKTTFARVVWFVAGGIFLMLLFSGSLISGSTEGGKGGPIKTDAAGAIIGQFSDNPITVFSDDGETMTVKDKYGCVFTYNFGQERWYDQQGLHADADACGFNDAVKGVNIREHIYNYRKNHR